MRRDSPSGPSPRRRLGIALAVLWTTLLLAPTPASAAVTIVPDGGAVAVQISVPGDTATATFDAAAGDRVSLEVVDVTIGTSACCSTKVSLVKPDGKTLVSTTLGTNGGFVDAVVLPLTGTYSIVVDPSSTNTGSATLWLYAVPPDVQATTAPGGAPVTVAPTRPGQNANITFPGTTGQRVSLVISDVTIGSSVCCSTRVAVLRPDGRTLSSTTVGTNGGFLDATTLPSAGTYTILVDPQGTATGGATIELDDVPPDATGALVPGGPAVTVTTTAAGQNAQLTFDGVSGRRVALSVAPSCCTVKVTIIRPDGKTLTSATVGMTGGFVDTATLPATGTYTVLADPQGPGTGAFTLTLYDVPVDVTGTIVPGGAPFTVTTTTPGQNARLAFDGVAGRRVALAVAPGCCSSRISILKPNGATLVSPTTISSFGGFIDAVVLPTTGAYSIVVDPQGAAVGDFALTLYDVPADIADTISPGGPPVTVTTTTPGQNGRLTFDGVSGRRISLRVTGACCNVRVTITRPTGSTLATLSAGVGGGFIDATTLPASGTYTIAVDPQGAATGSVTLTLYDVPADVAATIVPGGPPVTVNIPTPGQNARLTFTGTSGQRVSLQTSGSCCNAQVSILKPDGTTLASMSTFGAGGFLDVQALSLPGTYTVLVDLNGAGTGSVTAALFDVPPDVQTTITSAEAGGSPVTVTLATPGQNARLAFNGTQGSRVSVELANVTIGSIFSGTNVSILKADGSALAAPVPIGTSGGLVDPVVLPASDTYTILVDPQGALTGSATVTLHEVPADITATIVPGGASLTLTLASPGQTARVTFTGTATQRISLELTGVTIGSSTCCSTKISLLRPDGSALVTPSSVGTSGGFIDTATLPTTGTYAIVVDPQGTSTGNITLKLNDVPADARVTAVPGGASVTVTTTVPGQQAAVEFTGAVGERVSFKIGPTCCIERVDLLAPDGTVLAGPTSFGTGGGFLDTEVLPAAGTYSLRLDPTGTAVGSTTVTIYAVPADATASFAVGSSVTLTTTVPGQNARATFAGTGGDGISLSTGPFNCCSTRVGVLAPDGTVLVPPTSFNPDGGVLLMRLPASGTYTVTVDPQGSAIGTTNLALAVDNTAPDPPTLTLTATGTDSFASGTTFFYRPSGAGGGFTVAAATNDTGAGIQKVRFPGLASGFTPASPVDDLASPYSQTYTWSTGASYSNTANTVTAFDRIGNTAASLFAVVPDTTPPATTDNTASIGSSWKNTTQTVALTPNDGAGSGPAATYATSDGSTPTTASPQGTSVSLASEGVFTVKYFSVDNVGNVEPVQTAGTQIRIDKTSPATATLDPLPAKIRNGQVLTGSGSDALSGVASIVYLYCAGGACTPSTVIGSSSAGPSYAVTWSAQPADGTYQVLARVQDTAGNTRDSAKQTITIDNTAPNTTISSGPANPTNATSASFAFTSTETGSTFECRLDGGPWSSCTSPKAYSALTVGSHAFDVRATDSVGNTDATPATSTWTIDLTAPDTTVTAGPSSPTTSTSPSFSFTSSEAGSTFQCQLDAGALTACTSPKSYAGLVEGAHTFSVRATDPAGNTDPTPASWSWTIDLTAPDTSITSGPANPTSSTSATFAFTATEAGSTFQCQLDGAGFSTCSSPSAYSGLASGGHTFQVKATDPAGNTDVTAASWTWTVDTTPPDTTITAAPANPTNGTTATFSFSANEAGSTFQCRLDGAAFSACTSPAAYSSLAPGSHAFEVRATDGAGNVDPTPAAYSWTIDTTPPETSIASGPADPTSQTAATFSFSADEPGSSFQCSLDGAAFASCTSPKTYSGLAEGSHTFRVRATDPAGNTDATPAAHTWRVDVTAPDTAITAQPADPTNATSATFSFSSEVGATFACQLDGTGWSGCVSPASYSALAAGSHTFSVRASDAAGNTDATPATFTWTVDTTAPDTTIASGPSGSTSATAATFAFSASETGSTFECALDGGLYAACTSPKTYTALAEGAHTFSVRATDAAGNTDGSPASRSWTVDTTAPAAPAITSPPDGTVNNTGVFTLSGTAEPGSTIQLFDGGSAAGSTTAAADGSWSRGLTGVADGSHSYTATATDAAGNTSAPSAARTVVVDTAAPNTVIGTGPLGSTSSTTASFTFSASEGSSTFECALDAGAYSACTSPKTYTALAEGAHTFSVHATDSAGNTDPTPATRSWTVDVTPPAAPAITSPADGSVHNTSSFTLSGTAEPGTIVELFDGAVSKGSTTAGAGGSWSKALTGVTDGSHVYTATATDAAGNASAPSSPHTVVVDTTAPDTAITAGPSGATASTSASFDFSSTEGGSSFQCSLDGAPFSACTAPQGYSGLAEGAHSFAVRAIDGAGNTDPTPANRAWTVDTTAPDTTIVAGPSDPTAEVTATFDFTSSEPGSTFECALDGGPFAACSSPHTESGLSPGSHVFEVRAVDAAGNVDATPASYSWSVT